jgi:hypothetical protein
VLLQRLHGREVAHVADEVDARRRAMSGGRGRRGLFGGLQARERDGLQLLERRLQHVRAAARRGVVAQRGDERVLAGIRGRRARGDPHQPREPATSGALGGQPSLQRGHRLDTAFGHDAIGYADEVDRHPALL